MSAARYGDPLKICLFGAGRIGRLHAANIARHARACLEYVVDVQANAADTLARCNGAVVTDTATALADPCLGAVVIASTTETHAALIESSAIAGKAIFCEKPLDLDIGRVLQCLRVVEQNDVPLGVGFNRRYDPTFLSLKRRIDEGMIGRLETLSITSRDPSPPPAGYIKGSGGMFRDMTIHDFDMARWLLGEEVVEVFASGSCLCDEAIGNAGDIDTATVVLKTASGRLVQICNSRRAVYGYDQRIEAFGSGGMLQAGNETPTRVAIATEKGITSDPPERFFLERYAQAYQAELNDFVESVLAGRQPGVSGRDGLAALVLAEAAQQSLATGQTVDPAAILSSKAGSLPEGARDVHTSG